MEEAESKASPLKKAIMQWAKNAASHRQKLILEGKANHQDKGSLNYQLANKLVLRFELYLTYIIFTPYLIYYHFYSKLQRKSIVFYFQ